MALKDKREENALPAHRTGVPRRHQLRSQDYDLHRRYRYGRGLMNVVRTGPSTAPARLECRA